MSKRLGIRQVAASRVYTNEKEFHCNHVVELFEHRVVRHYPLRDEMPMTEWLGGTIILHDGEAFHANKVLSPAELGTDNSCGDSHVERL